jgi:hypothetical protein
LGDPALSGDSVRRVVENFIALPLPIAQSSSQSSPYVPDFSALPATPLVRVLLITRAAFEAARSPSASTAAASANGPAHVDADGFDSTAASAPAAALSKRASGNFGLPAAGPVDEATRERLAARKSAAMMSPTSASAGFPASVSSPVAASKDHVALEMGRLSSSAKAAPAGGSGGNQADGGGPAVTAGSGAVMAHTRGYQHFDEQ